MDMKWKNILPQRNLDDGGLELITYSKNVNVFNMGWKELNTSNKYIIGIILISINELTCNAQSLVLFFCTPSITT